MSSTSPKVINLDKLQQAINDTIDNGNSINTLKSEVSKLPGEKQNGGEIFNDYENNSATGAYSHAEGFNTSAKGNYSHVEGYYTKNYVKTNVFKLKGIVNETDLTAIDLNILYSDLLAAGIEEWFIRGINNYVYIGYNHKYIIGATILDIVESDNSNDAIIRLILKQGDYNTSVTEIISALGGDTTTSYFTPPTSVNMYVWMPSNPDLGELTNKDNYIEFGVPYSHAEGYGSEAGGIGSHAEGYHTKAASSYSHTEGNITIAKGSCAHAEGWSTKAEGNDSHAEGSGTIAKGPCSHAEGKSTTASGISSHAEGEGTTAIGNGAHAEGEGTTAIGGGAHAGGEGCIAVGYNSYASGYQTKAYGNSCHAEGSSSEAGKSGENISCAFAEGYNTKAKAFASHTAGECTVAGYNHQFIVGRYNQNQPDTLFEVGSGTSDSSRGNAFHVYSDGSANLATQGKLSNSILIRDSVYPVGSVWIGDNTNPKNLFGGEWTLIDKDFIGMAGDSSNHKTVTVGTKNKMFNFSNTSFYNGETSGQVTHVLGVVRTSDSIRIRLKMRTKQQVTLNGAVAVGSFDLSKLGLTGLSLGNEEFTAFSDDANGLACINITYEGVVYIKDALIYKNPNGVTHDILPAGCTFTLDATFPISYTSKSNDACNKFYWKRTS